MASTEQIRKWFHSGVVLNHADRGTTGYHPHCDHDHAKVGFPKDGGGTFAEPVHPVTFEAFTAYVTVMRHHDETMPSSGGVNSCRNIGGTNMPSLHAYLCAVDLPPNSRKSSVFIRDVEKIRTRSGAQVFRNLKGDRMHDQINCSPKALATGIDWSTVVGDNQSGEEAMLPLNKGDRSEDIRLAKDRMNETYGLTLDLGGGNPDGALYDEDLKTAVKDHLIKYTGDKSGDRINANMWNGLLRDFIIKVVPAGTKGDKGNTGSQGLPGVDGEDGKPATLTVSGDQTLP